MTDRPADGVFDADDTLTVSEKRTALEDTLQNLKEHLGGAASSELTIAGNSITPTAAVHTVDTQADAALDELHEILTTNHPDGRLLLLRAENANRTVRVFDSSAAGSPAGNITLLYGQDQFDISNTSIAVLLQRVGSQWIELLRTGRQDPRRLTDDSPHDVQLINSWDDAGALDPEIYVDANGNAFWTGIVRNVDPELNGNQFATLPPELRPANVNGDLRFIVSDVSTLSFQQIRISAVTGNCLFDRRTGTSGAEVRPYLNSIVYRLGD